MELLFVRHGETEANRRHIHQPPEEPLNKAGQTDARAAAGVVAAFAPSYLIASTMWRTIETAEIIGREVAMRPELNELFMELNRPSHIFGCRHFGLRSIGYMWQWFFNTDPTYWERYGGESRAVFLERLLAAKDYLETLPPDARVVVVSHSIFINFFVTHICSEQPIPFWRALFLLLKIKNLDNGKSVRVSFDHAAATQTCAWSKL